MCLGLHMTKLINVERSMKKDSTKERSNNLKLLFPLTLFIFLTDQLINTGVEPLRNPDFISKSLIELDLIEVEIVQRNSVREDRFTILLSTYDRDESLYDNLYHYLHCPFVEEVFIVWFDIDRTVPSEFDIFANPAAFPEIKRLPKVTFLHFTEHLLSNRLLVPPSGFKTRAVFSVDDDVRIDLKLLETGFKIWYSSYIEAIVGFEPRFFDLHGSGQGYTPMYSCHQCVYNTVWTTKGAFLDQKYFSEVWKTKYTSVMDLVKKYRTGEDMLLSYVIAASNYEIGLPIKTISVQQYSDFRPFKLQQMKGKIYSERIKLVNQTHLRHKIKPKTKSLHKTTSQYRPDIKRALEKLSNQHFGVKTEVFMLENEWYFVNGNLEVVYSRNLCGTKLKEELVCKH
eukprot:snap_masked-scaffold_3-processed-gene-18.23-mRNA-1 protein AED:1.00 eAED:1.00 QI:0/0/0/0/1/1/2/0/397